MKKDSHNLLQIRHPIDEAAMTQIACRIVEAYGDHINYFRLMKLLYIIEHESWKRLGHPAMGGNYYSMHAGPMISEAANASDPELAEKFKIWASHLRKREFKNSGTQQVNEIQLVRSAGRDDLSDALLKIVDEVIANTKLWKNKQIENYVHDPSVFGEYKEQPKGKRAPISAEEILTAAGKTEAKIKKLQSESNHWKMFEAALG